MGIIAWIILGLLAGVIAKAVLPGSDPGGLIVTTLVGVAGALLGGFIARALDVGDIRVSGDDSPIDDRGATPIALLFHELSTNAAKYGALSVEAGRIDVDVSLSDGTVRIVWQEDGGPVIAGEPDQVGFGTRLAQLSVEHQLGGKLERIWRPSGLRVEVSVLAERLHRDD